MKNAVNKALKATGDDPLFHKRVVEQSALPAEIDTDVVIVGCGGAGLAAAISALENGARVTIIEKMGYLGGSTNACGGVFNASDTKFQKAFYHSAMS